MREVPERGMLSFWMDSDGLGHMGIVVHVEENEFERSGIVEVGHIVTIEANTASCKSGVEGTENGVHRHVRPVSKWDGFIEWW